MPPFQRRFKKKSGFDTLAAEAANKFDKLAAEAASYFDKHTQFIIPDHAADDLLQEAAMAMLRKIRREEAITESKEYENTQLDEALLVIVGALAARDGSYMQCDGTVYVPRKAIEKARRQAEANDEESAELPGWNKHQFSDETLFQYGRNRFSRGGERQLQVDLEETLDWLYVELCVDDFDRRIVYCRGIEGLSIEATATRVGVSKREVAERIEAIRARRTQWENN